MKANELVITSRSGLATLDLAELWQYRQLVVFFLWRDLIVRYKQTVVGVAWLVLQPLATMLIFTFLFGRLAKMPSDGLPYAVFSCAGVFCWQCIGSAVPAAATSLWVHRGLLTKIYFPRIILPMATNLLAIVDFLIALVLFVPALAYFHTLSWNFLAIFALVPLLFIVTLGPSILLAALVTHFRDFRIILPFMMQVIMFGSPIAYSIGVVPQEWRLLYCLNPVVGVVEAMRWALVGRTEITLSGFCISAAMAVALLFCGIFAFSRVERSLADVL